MTDTGVRLRIEPVEDVTPGAEVRHFDELDEEVVQRLPELVPGRTGSVRLIGDRTVVDAFETCTCDVVKFTEFYRIERL